MALSSWKKLRQVFELKNPWWTYRHDEFEMPSGKKGEYHYVHTNGASMIIPVRDDGMVILVNQYRYLCNRESIEFPCGSVKEGSTYDDTAVAELIEETGFKANSLECIAEFNPYNGVTDEMCKVYIARSLTPAHAKKDDTEEFEYVYLTPKELDDNIVSGKIWDGMTLAAWALARHKAGK